MGWLGNWAGDRIPILRIILIIQLRTIIKNKNKIKNSNFPLDSSYTIPYKKKVFKNHYPARKETNNDHRNH